MIHLLLKYVINSKKMQYLNIKSFEFLVTKYIDLLRKNRNVKDFHFQKIKTLMMINL